MDIIADIFEALGGPTAIAAATGDPVQTVDSWLGKNNIPRWRRPSVVEAARKLGKPLSAQAEAYLASSDRLPRIERVRRPRADPITQAEAA